MRPYQKQIIDHYFDQLPRGGRILEIGPSPDMGSAIYLRDALSTKVTAVSMWKFEPGDIGDDIELRFGDVFELALEIGHFDIILGLSILEHIERIHEFGTLIRSLLKPGGVALLSGGPLWHSSVGHHLWVDGENKYRFNEDSNPIEPWDHLLSGPKELGQKLSSKLAATDTAKILEFVQFSDSINRRSHLEIESSFTSAGLDVAAQYYKPTPVPAELGKKLALKYPGVDCTIQAIILFLSLPAHMKNLPGQAESAVSDSPDTGENMSESSKLTRLKDYFSRYGAVEGWVWPEMLHAVGTVAKIQEDIGLHGAIGEIGVYHGKFFLALEQIRNTDEISLAIDVFDDQHLNIDRSGFGNTKSSFASNLAEYSPDPDGVAILSADSTSLTTGQLMDYTQGAKFRIFSVDGGHMPHHVVSDLKLIEQAIANDGVIFLDDYLNQDWPGVHEGFIQFMLHHNSRLAPFAYLGNKLLLTTITSHENLFTRFGALSKNSGFEIKKTQLCNYDTWSIRK